MYFESLEQVCSKNLWRWHSGREVFLLFCTFSHWCDIVILQFSHWRDEQNVECFGVLVKCGGEGCDIVTA